jgi:hypothetical protein
MSPPTSGLKSSKKSGFAFYPLHAGFLLGLLFNLEDGGDLLLWNIG